MAALVWNGDGEPLGWERCISKGRPNRYRPDGDASREYLETDDEEFKAKQLGD